MSASATRNTKGSSKRSVESRKWLPTVADLIDRLSIHQLKEVMLPEQKAKYAAEMKDIVHDLDLLIDGQKLSGTMIHLILLLGQINAHIWYNESKARRGEDQDIKLLKLTHGLNGIRNRLMNRITQELDPKERLDYKTDCLAAEFKDWEVSILK